MLLWAGSFKMTRPGAEGYDAGLGAKIARNNQDGGKRIIPLVSNSPLIWWQFKVFGPYIGSDFIGLTEPGINGMRYMSNLGLFLFKDVISLGVSLYLISYFGKKAILSENK
jgi:uncharacterized membrane protein YkgB